MGSVKTTEPGPWNNVVDIFQTRNPRPKELSIGWDPNKYLNIWVANLSRNVVTGRALAGHAYFPWWPRYKFLSNVVLDGIVMNDETFNEPIGVISTLTHEVGHWLGLYHINGDGVSNSGACTSDEVQDTPPQRHQFSTSQQLLGAPLFPCINTNTIYFANGSGPNCTPNPDPRGNMIMDFMDYSIDECRTMFTRGQVLRMRQTLLNQRKDLLMNDTITICSSGGPNPPGELNPLQAFLEPDDDFAFTGDTFIGKTTVRGGSGLFEFFWEYRLLEVGATDWQTTWTIMPNTTDSFSMAMPNVRSVQVRVRVLDIINLKTVVATTIIRNPANNQNAVRRLAARRIGTLKKPSTVSSSQNTSNNSSSLRLSVNPNPASSTIIASYILEEESSVTLEVLNILQQKQVSPIIEPAKLLGKHSVDMDVSHFQTGTYYIRCTSVSREGIVRQQTIPFQVIK